MTDNQYKVLDYLGDVGEFSTIRLASCPLFGGKPTLDAAHRAVASIIGSMRAAGWVESGVWDQWRLNDRGVQALVAERERRAGGKP